MERRPASGAGEGGLPLRRGRLQRVQKSQSESAGADHSGTNGMVQLQRRTMKQGCCVRSTCIVSPPHIIGEDVYFSNYRVLLGTFSPNHG